MPLSAWINIFERALAQLPEKYRIVFVLREVEGMSISETAECLNISASNVKVRLNRARIMLRDLLTGYYETKDLYDFEKSSCDDVVKNVLTHIEAMR
jgi:predicted RNA polymerase sigma factor